jgi:hypothetical protein
MKLVDTKKKLTIAFSTVLGLTFATFLLYDQRGTIGQTEIISLTFTTIIALTIIYFITKKANK